MIIESVEMGWQDIIIDLLKDSENKKTRNIMIITNYCIVSVQPGSMSGNDIGNTGKLVLEYLGLMIWFCIT